MSVVYTDTEYGNNGYNLLSATADRYNICISEPQSIEVERFTDQDYNEIITTLMNKINARGEFVETFEYECQCLFVPVVIVYTDSYTARNILSAAKRILGPLGKLQQFVWIASDAWCCREYVVHGLEDVVEGSISITPLHYSLEGFTEYFKSLRPENNQMNPWFAEFWEQHFNCSLSTNPVDMLTGKSPCTDSMTLGNDIQQSPSLHFIRDAFYSFTVTFQQIYKQFCNGTVGVCDRMWDTLLDGRKLNRRLKKAQFKDEGGRTFKFLDNGDAPPRYTVVNFQRMTNGTYEWKQVGTYMMTEYSNNATVNLKLDKVLFKSDTPLFPRSFCSDPCQVGQIKLQLEGDTCCWLCTNCSQYQYLPDEFHCSDCPWGESFHYSRSIVIVYFAGTIPSGNKTLCLPLPPTYLSITNWWRIGSILFALVGMVLVVFTWIVFWYFAETPIIKAAGRELSYLHLTGIFLSYSTTFVIIAPPKPLSCALTRFLLGFCYTICYSAIATKTNRISRIFRHRSCQRPKFTSPQSQLIIAGLLIFVEIALNVFWIFYDPPNTMFVYPNRDTALLICSGSDQTSYLYGLVYPLILIGFCTGYAFKTRKCPEGFNEARYITFTNYTTCVVWLAFLPLFVMLSNHTPLRIVTLCLLLSVSGTVQLFCLFVPKVNGYRLLRLFVLMFALYVDRCT